MLRSSNLKSLTLKDQRVFFRQLEVMLSASIPLYDALDLLSRGEQDIGKSELFAVLSRSIGQGSTFSRALQQADCFPNRIVSYVHLGEESGSLDKVLDIVANQLETDDNTRSKLKSQLTYPLVISCLAFAGLGFMIYFFLPRMLSFMHSLGTELPLVLRAMAKVASLFSRPWFSFLFLQLCLCLVAALWSATKTEKFSRILDRLLIRFPLSRELQCNLAALQFSTGLHTLLKCGCPLARGLKLVAATLSNQFAGGELQQVTREVALEGSSLADALRQRESFPSALSDLVSCGEESGSLEVTLQTLKRFFEDRIDEELAQISALIEPTVLIIMGATVGGLTLMFFLPITKVISQL